MNLCERLSRAALGLAVAAAALAAPLAQAADAGPIKIGLILPMTGQSASTGRQIEAAVKLWVAQNGNKVAGRQVEVILKDDGAVPDTTRRLAQELIVNDKVAVLAGFGITPTITLVADYGPGFDAEKFFDSQFRLDGGQVMEKLRTPLRSPDFAPVLQKVADAKPDALFVFLPSGQGATFMKQFAERGLDKSGVRLIATGDVTDDDQLADMGEVAIGVVNSHHYSAAHPSEANKKFVKAFEAANKFRPNFMAVGGYDGMRVIYKALEATKGEGGEKLLEAMKGQIFESPRGPVLIDAQTRDIVQDVYIRKVERVPAMGNQLYNVEFDVIKQVKDPGKAK